MEPIVFSIQCKFFVVLTILTVELLAGPEIEFDTKPQSLCAGISANRHNAIAKI
jgi:hypothetical protein